MLDILIYLGFTVLGLIGLVSIFILGIFLVYLVTCTIKYKDLILGKDEESKEESEENKDMVNKEDLDFKE